MHFERVVIDGLAYALPDDVWTSDRIEQALHPLYKRLRLPEGRLEMMTGIHERRHWSMNFLPSEASIQAGEALFKQANFSRRDVDILIHASVCRNRLEPATAAYVHQGLRLSAKTQFFDLSNACLSVLNAMIVGASMIEAGTARSVLIISGENGKPLLSHTLKFLNNDLTLTRKAIKPYFANLTIGSGAVAILLRNYEDVSSPKPLLLGGIVCTDSAANHLCEGDVSQMGLVMQTEANALLEAGVCLSKKAWNAFKIAMKWDEQTPQHIITHQVGRQHRKRLYEALELDKQKDFSTFEYLGNTGSAALPLSLMHAVEMRPIHSNDKVLLLGIGSGLSTIMLGILWQK